MNVKIFFILFVLFLLIGCAEKKVIEEPKSQEGLEESDTGISDIFAEVAEGEEIEPPPVPS